MLEKGTLTLARLFQNYSATDAANTYHIAESYAAYYYHKNVTASDLAAAQELPLLEVNLTIQAVREAVSECLRVKNGGYRKISRTPPLEPLVLDTTRGYFVDPSSNTPYFTTGYSQSPAASVDVQEQAAGLGMSCNVLYFSPRMILSSAKFNTSSDWALEALNTSLMQQRLTHTNGYVALGNGNLGHGNTPTSHALPDWYVAIPYPVEALVAFVTYPAACLVIFPVEMAITKLRTIGCGAFINGPLYNGY